jgi:hypothetical protein
MAEGYGGSGEVRQMNHSEDTILVASEPMPEKNPMMPLVYTIIGGVASILLLLLLLKIKR